MRGFHFGTIQPRTCANLAHPCLPCQEVEGLDIELIQLGIIELHDAIEIKRLDDRHEAKSQVKRFARASRNTPLHGRHGV